MTHSRGRARDEDLTRGSSRSHDCLGPRARTIAISMLVCAATALPSRLADLEPTTCFAGFDLDTRLETTGLCIARQGLRQSCSPPSHPTAAVAAQQSYSAGIRHWHVPASAYALTFRYRTQAAARSRPPALLSSHESRRHKADSSQ